jgi:hypothetical protein
VTGKGISDLTFIWLVRQHLLQLLEVQGEGNMRIRLTQVFFAFVTTLFCTISVSATPPDAGPAAQQPLLLAGGVVKKFVCHIKPNNNYKTQELPADTADKLVANDPGQQEWIEGKCEDNPSLS